MQARRFLQAAGGALCALAALLLIDCPLTPEGRQGGELPSGDSELYSELFEEPEGSPGTRVFLVNDPDLWGPYGSTLWYLTGSSQEPFAMLDLELTKFSGDGSAGFGAVLCHREDPGLGETMLVVMINTRQQFIIGEVVGTEFQAIVPWTDCAALAAGSAVNRLRVRREGEVFTVSFNGLEARSFRDEQAPQHLGGSDGLIAVISPLDRFPLTAVHVVFRQL